MVAGKSLRFGALQTDGENLYWSESRPGEGGRGVIVRLANDGAKQDMLAPPWSARSRVHEYGGGEYLAAGGRLFFVEADSQDIYEARDGAKPSRLTELADTRFADMSLDAKRNRLVAVAERVEKNAHEPENFICAVDLETGAASNLVEGADFYASPRLSPDGQKLAWLQWNLPDMPWESAALYVAEFAKDGSVTEAVRVAGGESSAAFQPEWHDGRLLFVSDQTGWGELYVWTGDKAEQLTSLNAELLRPQWVFRMQSYVPFEDNAIATAPIEQGQFKVVLVNRATGQAEKIPNDLRSIDYLAPFGDGLAVIGATDMSDPSVWHLQKNGELGKLHPEEETGLAPDTISKGEMLLFEGEGGELFALYYPPTNAAFEGSDDELPPAIILVHGGPTGMADRGLKLKTQYWTSRGFAVADLDYAGSAGYGRSYRKRLDGQWGVQDVKDVAALATHLIEAGLADPERLLISGGSAGGYTVLMALAKLDVFAAGACTYGVADLAQLQRITHKFESGYLYGLTGTTPDDCEKVFAARSPLHCADEISSPVIFFQGLDDKVVPPRQSRDMVETLRKGGVPVAYREFEGEGHGFRKADTIIEVLGAEYAFYARILGLEVEQDLPEIQIENFDKLNA